MDIHQQVGGLNCYAKDTVSVVRGDSLHLTPVSKATPADGFRDGQSSSTSISDSRSPWAVLTSAVKGGNPLSKPIYDLLAYSFDCNCLRKSAFCNKLKHFGKGQDKKEKK